MNARAYLCVNVCICMQLHRCQFLCLLFTLVGLWLCSYRVLSLSLLAHQCQHISRICFFLLILINRTIDWSCLRWPMPQRKYYKASKRKIGRIYEREKISLDLRRFATTYRYAGPFTSSTTLSTSMSLTKYSTENSLQVNSELMTSDFHWTFC